LKVREALRAVLLAHTSSEAPPRVALEVLRSTAARHPVHLTFDDSGAPDLMAPPGPTTADGILVQVLTTLAAASPDELQRLKACANPECGWVFYDGSRSRTGSWCVMGVCGARHKMSRYRSRQGEAGDET
jgi:predicted RNA-binding Zn ribbon-like protein